MSGTGLSIGPIALFLAVLAYILKRWWDNVDSITEERRRAYLAYYEACYHLTVRLLEIDVTQSDIKREDTYADWHKATPEFYLCVSPTVLNISDYFLEHMLPFANGNVPDRDSDEYVDSARQLNGALIVLREAMKAELFTTSPRFQFERWRQKKKWQAFIEENEK